MKESEKFYGTLNETISFFGNIAGFVIVLIVIFFILSYLYEDPSWLSLWITIIIFLVWYGIKHRSKEEVIDKKVNKEKGDALYKLFTRKK
ncbi:MAG: hypothetical protein AABW67_02620 [Nanoarchaeota archaeon]